MFQEFAIEPLVVANWERLPVRHLFENGFGLDAGRILCALPVNWKRAVHDAFNEVRLSDVEKLRAVELVNLLTNVVSRRHGVAYDPTRSWLEQAVAENGRRPFSHVLAVTNAEAEMEAIKAAGFTLPPSVAIQRTPDAMSLAVAPLLRMAEEIVLIDPYFKPMPSFCKPLRAFLQAATTGRDLKCIRRLEIHYKDGEYQDNVFDRYSHQLASSIPVGLTVNIFKWAQRLPNGDGLHNRYILTNVGGVSFPNGLSEGTANETDVIGRIGKAAYQLLWRQYTARDIETPAFILKRQIAISGTRR